MRPGDGDNASRRSLSIAEIGPGAERKRLRPNNPSGTIADAPLGGGGRERSECRGRQSEQSVRPDPHWPKAKTPRSSAASVSAKALRLRLDGHIGQALCGPLAAALLDAAPRGQGARCRGGRRTTRPFRGASSLIWQARRLAVRRSSTRLRVSSSLSLTGGNCVVQSAAG